MPPRCKPKSRDPLPPTFVSKWNKPKGESGSGDNLVIGGINTNVTNLCADDITATTNTCGEDTTQPTCISNQNKVKGNSGDDKTVITNIGTDNITVMNNCCKHPPQPTRISKQNKTKGKRNIGGNDNTSAMTKFATTLTTSIGGNNNTSVMMKFVTTCDNCNDKC